MILLVVLDDLIARSVRFIGDPHERIKEDHLRILRFFRFNAQYGKGAVDASGLAACVHLQQGLKSLSAERIGSEILKLLLMPRAIHVLETMFAHGLLLPLTSRVPHLSRFRNWLTLEGELNRAPDTINRLGALFMLVDEDADKLANKLRLSNKQKRVMKNWVNDVEINEMLSEKQARARFYQLRDDYPMRVAINWLLSRAGINDRDWRTLYDLPERWQPPIFPLKGQDLLNAGMSAGPAVGKKLLSLEHTWIESDFTLTGDELLDQLNIKT